MTGVQTCALPISNKTLGTCQVFSSNKQNGHYDFKGAAQARYLKICLDSSREYGEKFYQEFLDTTIIDGQPLSQLAERLSI